MTKESTHFDLTGSNVVKYQATSLKDIKLVLKKIGVYTKALPFVAGMFDSITGECNGYYFFSSAPENLEKCDAIPEMRDGKVLSVFLVMEKTNPCTAMYEKSPGCKLGGWRLWGEINGDDYYLAAERILVGSAKLN